MSEWPRKITLMDPITYTDGGATATVTEVTVQKPLVKHMRKMDRKAGQVSQSVVLVGATTGLSDAALDEMSVRDFRAVAAVVAEEIPLEG